MKIYYTLISHRVISILVIALLSLSSYGQRIIEGKISDDTGSPLIGVNIVLASSSSVGTITDFDGNFSIEVPNGPQELIVTYIGYAKKTIKIVDGQKRYNITMQEDANKIDEVVVIGYGEVKKRDYIGSVGTISSKQIENQAITSYNQALAGQISNVQVRQGTGVPGGGPEFTIRGLNSISPQSAPLIVIDDIPIGNYNAERDNFLTLINPDDIESISVIKDASGKAIYGSRASNGLVIIKTKRGRRGEPKISYTNSFAMQTVPSWEIPDVMNATELATFHKERFEDEFFIKNGRYPEISEVPEHVQDPSMYGEGTDWFGELTRNAPMQNHNISLRGGTETFNYNMTFGYLNQDGIVIESNLKRYSLRANFDAKIKPWLKMELDVAPSWTDNRTGNTDPGSGQFSVYNVLNVARWADPSAPLYDEFGNYTRDTRGELTQFYQVNPVRYLKEQINDKQNRSVQGGIGLTADLYKGLKVKTKASTFYFNNRGRQFEPASINGSGLTPAFNNVYGNANTGRYENIRLLSETQLLYNTSINGNHNIDALLGYTAEFTQETTLGSGVGRVVDENFFLVNSGNAWTFDPNDPEKNTQIFFNTSEGISEQSLLSYIGRLQYNYKEKYYLTASLRRDGSSRFGPENIWGVFPSGALAYRVSKESWFPKNGLISDLKFEVSAGTSGNNRIGNYEWRGSVAGADYVIGDGRVEGTRVGSLPNPFLKWEETRQLDVGMDVGLMRDKLSIELDYYVSTTNNLLFNTPVPGVTGFNNRTSNLGSIENRGVEATINYRPILTDKFSWNINANVGVNRNKVLSIGDADRPIFTIPAGNGTRAGIIQVGSPIGLFRGLVLTGLYTEELLADESVPKYPGAVVGAPIYEDYNGDGVLDRNNDIQIMGNPWPKFTYGFTNNLTFGDLSLRIITYGEYGSQILDLSREFMQNTDKGSGGYLGVFNLDREVIGRWRPGDEDFSTIRVPSTQTAESSQRWRWPNNGGLFDGSFFKISNITVSYNFNNLVSGIKAISGLSANFSVQNVGYITSYDGNPEIRRASGGPLERNVNYSSYPVPRTYTLGFNLTI